MHRVLIICAALAGLSLSVGADGFVLAQSSSSDKCFELIRACVAGCSVHADDEANDGCVESCPSLGLCGSDQPENTNTPGGKMPGTRLPASRMPGSKLPGSKMPVGGLNP